MGFRTVVINNRCKLELKMNYLVCRGEEVKRIFIEEISTLIIATPSVTITGMLMTELVKRGVKVVFCDEKHNPQMELVPYYDNYISSKKVENQSCGFCELETIVIFRRLFATMQTNKI